MKDILTILSEYGIEIRKEGSVIRAFCPFHKDTHKPNFTVYPDEKGGSWFCFACSVGGNSAFFISKMEGIPYSEALQKVNGEMSSLEELNEELEGVNLRDSHVLNLEINITARKICRKLLRVNPDLRPKIMSYLKYLDDTLTQPITSKDKMLELIRQAQEISSKK